MYLAIRDIHMTWFSELLRLQGCLLASGALWQREAGGSSCCDGRSGIAAELADSGLLPRHWL